jgi:hypothetical protein
METKKRQNWIVIGGCLIGFTCLGVIVIAGIFLFGVSFFGSSHPITVGPTFSSAEALAYDVVYESNIGQASDIHALQTIQSEEYRAVLMGYELDGEQTVRFLLTRDDGFEFFVENVTFLLADENDDFTVSTILHENGQFDEVGVYGRILTPTINHLIISWENGTTANVTPVENGYLFFQAWSPADGSAEPIEITAYDGAGTAVSTLSLTPNN